MTQIKFSKSSSVNDIHAESRPASKSTPYSFIKDILKIQPGSPAAAFARNAINKSEEHVGGILYSFYMINHINDSMSVSVMTRSILKNQGITGEFKLLILERDEAMWFGLPWGHDNIDADLGL